MSPFPVTTSVYWKVNSACWPEVSVTTAGGWVGGPERFTVKPLTMVIGTRRPRRTEASQRRVALHRARRTPDRRHGDGADDGAGGALRLPRRRRHLRAGGDAGGRGRARRRGRHARGRRRRGRGRLVRIRGRGGRVRSGARRTRRGDQAGAHQRRRHAQGASQPSKSSGRTDSRNWRNSPTSSSGTSSSRLLVALERQDDALGLHQLVGHEDRGLGPHRHRHRVGGPAGDDGPHLAPAQMELGEVGGGAQLGDEDLFHLDLEGAEHVLHEVMRQGPGHLHPLDGVGNGRRLGIADEDGQGPALTVRLLEEEDRRVGLQVHPYRTEKHSDHE